MRGGAGAVGDSGTTLLLAATKGRALWVASCGDSRSVLQASGGGWVEFVRYYNGIRRLGDVSA